MTSNLPATLDARLIGPIRNDLEEARRDLLHAVAVANGGRRILGELMKADTFTPVGKPGIALRLFRQTDGLYLGHARVANGKIVENARWLKVSSAGSRLLTSAGMLSGQLMLVEMSQKLDRIQGSVDAIRKALDDDRMQSLLAAINGTKDALNALRPENRQALLTSTIPHLNDAIHKTVAALKREIAEVPRLAGWRIIQAVRNREPEMRKKLAQAETTFHACLEGISILAQAYFAVRERALGCDTAIRALDDVNRAGINDAEFRARLLAPVSIDDRPEAIWSAFRLQLPELLKMIERERDKDASEIDEIDMDVSPAQIAAALDDKTPV